MFDRRISKFVDADGDGAKGATVERFVYDGDNIALTFDGLGNQTHRYLYGTGVDSVVADEKGTGEVLWALSDNQGSVRDVINSNGVVRNHLVYDSFGKVISETNPLVNFRFGYTGQELDPETGNNFYDTRFLDTYTGSFIQADKIGFAGFDSNLYSYVFNSPTNYIDPNGQGALGKAIGGGIGAGIGSIAGGTVGGLAGGAGGASGGTLVAPGVGTVGGGAAGAISGATAGEAIGA